MEPATSVIDTVSNEPTAATTISSTTTTTNLYRKIVLKKPSVPTASAEQVSSTNEANGGVEKNTQPNDSACQLKYQHSEIESTTKTMSHESKHSKSDKSNGHHSNNNSKVKSSNGESVVGGDTRKSHKHRSRSRSKSRSSKERKLDTKHHRHESSSSKRDRDKTPKHEKTDKSGGDIEKHERSGSKRESKMKPEKNESESENRKKKEHDEKESKSRKSEEKEEPRRSTREETTSQRDGKKSHHHHGDRTRSGRSSSRSRVSKEEGRRRSRSRSGSRNRRRSRSRSRSRGRHRRSSPRNSRNYENEEQDMNLPVFTQNLNLSQKFLQVANLPSDFLKQAIRAYNQNGVNSFETLEQQHQQMLLLQQHQQQIQHLAQQQPVMKSSNSKSVSDFIELCKNLSKQGDKDNFGSSNGSLLDSSSSLAKNSLPRQTSNFTSAPAAPSKPTTNSNSEVLVKLFPVSSGTIHRVAEVAPPINSTEKKQETKPEAINTVAIYKSELDYQIFPSETSNNSTKMILESKNLGKFTGKNDARLLKPEELEGDFKAWARKDLLKNTAPITMGIGKKLLEKMGWREGEGLGKTRNGLVEPINPDIKVNRQGLSSHEDKLDKKLQLIQCDGKHPVSFLLELCRARRWTEPVYETVACHGPSHMPLFLMRVVVNGIPYQPTVPSPNKKQAKVCASISALNALGFNFKS